jgi:hypothetical protein
MRSRTASSRSFGYLIAAVLALVGGLHYWAQGQGHIGWFVAAVPFLAIAIAMPRLLLPLKRLWLKLGHVLHAVVSPVILGALYVFSIVSVGLLLKLFGKDILSLKRNPTATSYWIRREPPGPDAASLRNQF